MEFWFSRVLSSRSRLLPSQTNTNEQKKRRGFAPPRNSKKPPRAASETNTEELGFLRRVGVSPESWGFYGELGILRRGRLLVARRGGGQGGGGGRRGGGVVAVACVRFARVPVQTTNTHARARTHTHTHTHTHAQWKAFALRVRVRGGAVVLSRPTTNRSATPTHGPRKTKRRSTRPSSSRRAGACVATCVSERVIASDAVSKHADGCDDDDDNNNNNKNPMTTTTNATLQTAAKRKLQTRQDQRGHRWQAAHVDARGSA